MTIPYGVFYSIHYDNVVRRRDTNNFWALDALGDFIDDPILMQSRSIPSYGGFSLNYSFNGLKSIDTIRSHRRTSFLSRMSGLMFYATDQNYADFETKTRKRDGSQVKAVTNVKAARGSFGNDGR